MAAMQMAAQIRFGEIPEPLHGMSARFRDPSASTKAERADAIMKQISAGVLNPMENIVDLEVSLEQLGYDRSTIERVLDGRRRGGTTSLASRLAQAV